MYMIQKLTSVFMFWQLYLWTNSIFFLLSLFTEKYTNYSTLAVYNENIDYVVGILVFLANIKFLRLLRFNKHVSELTSTFRHAGKDLFYFFVTFFIIAMGFGTWGLVIFGKTLLTFSTLTYTLETMLSMLVGKFDLNEMDQADR